MQIVKGVIKTAGAFCSGWIALLSLVTPIATTSGEDFEVLVSEPWTIHSAAWGGGTYLLKLANGSVVSYYFEKGPETTYDPYALISSDSGKSWRRTSWPGDSRCIGVLRDGTIVALGYIANVRRTGNGEFVYPRWVSRDHWKTWQGPLPTPVTIPQGRPGVGDDMQPFGGPLFWKSLVELPDGRLLATMYGHFEGDDVPIPHVKSRPGFNKYRTILSESKNQGASWSLVATIAYDPSVGQESFCEPALTQLPNGELLCIMRTGYTHHPMYTSRSSDSGRTWSKPVSTGLTGVDPRLITLDNGLIACVYGVKEYDRNRRERRIMFSRDAGRTWSHNTLVFAGYGGSYPDAVELKPGKILYVYDANGFAEPNQTAPTRNYLRLATVTVRPMDPKRGLVPFPISR